MIVTRPAPHYDVVAIGAGPAGLAAAVGARAAGARSVLLVDREPEPGGILQQCIHNGFGLHTFGEELTGPEYAERFVTRVMEQEADLLLDSFIVDVNPSQSSLSVIGESFGAARVNFGSLVLGMGSRERTRGALRIPGTRPAGIYTAGLAQKMVNMMGVLPGKRIVILGSGDIGLIMARRLVLEGCDVLGVYELLPYSSGLNRNIVQCLHDFNIPLHLSTTVTDIGGRDRVEWVEVAEVDEAMNVRPDRPRHKIDCDTVLLSVGLIPENELTRRMGAILDLSTGGPIVDSTLRTSVPGVFACGNVLHVHDLVDYVAEESERAGRFAAEHAIGLRRPQDAIRLVPGQGVRYIVPHTISPDREQTLFFRVAKPMEGATVMASVVGVEQQEVIAKKKILYAFPAEMMRLTLSADKLSRHHAQSLRIDVIPRPSKRSKATTQLSAMKTGGGS